MNEQAVHQGVRLSSLSPSTADATSLWPARIRVVAGPWSTRLLLDTRTAVTVAVLAALAVALGMYALTLGDSDLSLSEVAAAITGTAARGTQRIVLEWRLPRIVVALVGGAALAASGAVFQTMTRNPLGSPDVIGFGTGAYSGALVATLLLPASTVSVTTGAFVGGLATAAVVYALSGRGGVFGFRLIVVGIAVGALLNALNSYLLVRARAESAISAAVWGMGSLNGVRWPDITPVIWSVALLLPACLLLARRLDLLELGDDHGQLLGIEPQRTRLVLLVLGVGLVSVVTAVVGPIAFVALAAPQIARRLVDASGAQILPSALVGGLLLLISDVCAQRLIAPSQLPVGMVTASLGGVYLIWLLTRARQGGAR